MLIEALAPYGPLIGLIGACTAVVGLGHLRGGVVTAGFGIVGVAVLLSWFH